jgi:hypothetical protein
MSYIILAQPVTRDPELVNRFANHPDIRPFVGGTGELDLTSAVCDPNVFLFGEHGGFCLSWSAPGTYEIHTMIVPEGRGAWAIEFAKEAKAYMVSIGAHHLWTRIHPDHRHTQIFTRKTGLKPCGTNTLDVGNGPVEWLLFDWRK